jgi:hypothetical protein
MRRFLFVLLAFTLSGCGALAPAQPTPVPPTPQVIIATVLVTVEAPSPIPPTAVPPTAVPPTAVPPPAQPAATEAAPASGATATATLPVSAGGPVFTDLVRSGSFLSLRCQPLSIVFNVTSINPSVVQVDFWYRLQDQQGTSITEWKNFGPMDTDKNGHFSLEFKSEDVHPDLRFARAWFDYEFIGLAKSGDVVGRSAKITKQITYMIDCPQ